MEIDCMTWTWKKRVGQEKEGMNRVNEGLKEGLRKNATNAFKSFVHKQVSLCNKYLE